MAEGFSGLSAGGADLASDAEVAAALADYTTTGDLTTALAGKADTDATVIADIATGAQDGSALADKVNAILAALRSAGITTAS